MGEKILEEFQMQSQCQVKCIPSLVGILTVSTFTGSSRIRYTTRETHTHTQNCCCEGYKKAYVCYCILPSNVESREKTRQD